jgi:hypothetical protein
MAALDLRPLSLGEILDRTFSIYRQNFLLFIGITALPQLLVLALQVSQILLTRGAATRSAGLGALGIGGVLIGFLIGVIVYLVAYLYAHGGTVFAVSDIYLGRPTTIGESLRKMRGHAANLFGVLMLQGLAMLAGFILLVIPGVYVACRLSTGVPAALLEDLGPSESLNRSWALTEDNAGRAFAIFCLYTAILYGLILLLTGPFLFLIAFATSQKDPAMVVVWTVCMQIGSFIATALVTPIITISTTVFYYDLRVRKEAFDLQMMINTVESIPGAPATPGLASPLS